MTEPTAASSALRPEIQGLRALAVGLVVIFHIWPNALPGGYVGVDVFFVISGYLITGLLARTALRDGSISLVEFYSRRARRLLPAATLVLLVTFAAMLALLPQARWEETAIQIAASALYVQNWVLAWLAVDYLGAENAASPVQHYWSLSIEEQFYFVWPLLMIATIWLSKRLGFSLKRAFIAGLALVFIASLVASVWLTRDDPALAYFVTHTRMWELALGGLLALTIDRFAIDARLRAVLLLAGVAGVVASAILYSTKTPFPGVAALLPTVGTVLIILAGDVRIGGFRGLDNTLLRYVGDRSYSIYLWHWPLITFHSVQHARIGFVDGIGLIALTLAISHLSYQYVEERYRHPRQRGEVRPLFYGLASILACVMAAGALQYNLSAQASASAGKVGTPDYPGPAALLANAPVPKGIKPIPDLASLKRDLPVVYGKCHQDQRSADPISCTLGDPEGTETIVLTGDSHAAQWIPALDEIAKQRKWKLVTFTKSACLFNRVPVRLGSKKYPSCAEWRENVIDRIKSLSPKVVFTSMSRYNYVKTPDMIEGLRSIWGELAKSDIQVVAIQDTPWMKFTPGDCLAGKGDCSSVLKDVEARSIYKPAAKDQPNVRVVDMTNALCGPKTCEAIVGNVIVWRDRHHMTATYSRSLAPYLAKSAGL